MSKATYLAAVSAWARAGSRGLKPNSTSHGIHLADVSSSEDAAAIDQGDPKPPAVSGWTWWDGTHADLFAWHEAIRNAHQGGPTFTNRERRRAETLYAAGRLETPSVIAAPVSRDPPKMRWSDHFQQVGSRTRPDGHSKTTPADEQVWQGYFEGKLLCIHTTVRLTGGNMAHFLVHSGARIGSHPWYLRGGHYVDMRVLSRETLSTEELKRLGELARTEDQRSIAVRQGRETLAEAVHVPPAA